jgi:hypothetical protein
MVGCETRLVGLYVDRARPEHWIVRDAEGRLWTVPSIENAWESRSPFEPGEDTELEVIPKHYLGTLGLPF